MIKVAVFFIKIIASVFALIAAACSIITSLLMNEWSYVIDENSLEKIWTNKRRF